MRALNTGRYARHAALAAGLAAAAIQLVASAPAQMREPAPLINEGGRGAIPGEYNVAFNVGRSPLFRLDARETREALAIARRQNAAAQALVRRLGATVHHSYDTAIVGFTAKLSPAALDAVRRAPGVAFVEPEIRYRGDTVQAIAVGFEKRGLDRIDRRLHPLDNMYTYSETGKDVNVYVIDTGILPEHLDFQGRAIGLQNLVPPPGGGTVDPLATADCHGHGTQMAGIVGGRLTGVAKEVKIYALRALDCNKNADPGTVTAAINAAAAHAALTPTTPAVVNMSLSGEGESAMQRAAIANAMAPPADLVFVVTAGDHEPTAADPNPSPDACNYMPAKIPEVITVGSVEVRNGRDERAPMTNWGTCIDLFAPGVEIYAPTIPDAGDPDCPTFDVNDTDCIKQTNWFSGTSHAAAHVSGVTARWLQTHKTATPSLVWDGIHNANNVAGSFAVIGGATQVWPGVIDPATNAVITNAPNEMLHYGSLDDGYNDGDPHITTVDGLRYDFQGAGEFVALREPNGFEVQTRKAAVATAATPLVDPYTGLANCVSVNTAVAARLGAHRMTFQSDAGGRYGSGMQLRIDGRLATPGANGLMLDNGARILGTPGGGLDVGFPDGTEMFVTPGFWNNTWYLNVAVLRTTATQGIMGRRPDGSWLPALPDGSSVGSMPASLGDRHIVLNEKFMNAWRVRDGESLFDYAPGASTATFTRANWPPADGRCVVAEMRPARPVPAAVAEAACRPLVDKRRRENCAFDVRVTGATSFAKTYLLSEYVHRSSTRVVVHSDREWVSAVDEPVTFTAVVAPRIADPKRPPAGAVTFIVDGREVARTKLDRSGRAVWRAPRLEPGTHRVAARFVPADRRSLPSLSIGVEHTVGLRRR